MLLSRFWYVVLALLLGAATFVLFLASSMYNRVGSKSMGERLSADSQVVSWYLKNDARERSAQLVKFALHRDIAKHLDEEGRLPVKQGALYPVLRSLEGQGLLESSVEPSVSGPPRKYYGITAAGRVVLSEWSDAWRSTRDFVDEWVEEHGD